MGILCAATAPPRRSVRAPPVGPVHLPSQVDTAPTRIATSQQETAAMWPLRFSPRTDPAIGEARSAVRGGEADRKRQTEPAIDEQVPGQCEEPERRRVR